MITNESQFSKKLIEYCRRANLWTLKTEILNNSGMPDLLISNNNKFILAELKVVKDDKQKITSVFKRSQRPWYVDYLKKSPGAMNLYIFVYNIDNGIISVIKPILGHNLFDFLDNDLRIRNITIYNHFGKNKITNEHYQFTNFAAWLLGEINK